MRVDRWLRVWLLGFVPLAAIAIRVVKIRNKTIQ